MPTCRFCDSAPASIKAHIIPQSFFVRHGNESQLIDTHPDSFPRRSPIGVYDREILCGGCEPKFGKYDDYGYRFFHNESRGEEIYKDTEASAQLIRQFDYALLNLFVLSVVWRASVSMQEFYGGVRLGPYENRIRDYLLSDTPSDPDAFPIILYRFEYPAELIPIMCPVRAKLHGRNFYQILLNGYLALVKVDNQPLPGPFKEVRIEPGKPICVLGRTYKGSPEHQIMVSAAKKAKI